MPFVTLSLQLISTRGCLEPLEAYVVNLTCNSSLNKISSSHPSGGFSCQQTNSNLDIRTLFITRSPGAEGVHVVPVHKTPVLSLFLSHLPVIAFPSGNPRTGFILYYCYGNRFPILIKEKGRRNKVPASICNCCAFGCVSRGFTTGKANPQIHLLQYLEVGAVGKSF